MDSIKLNILTDDIVRKRGFLAEHGLSLFIETDDKNVLFDTGQGDVFCKNAVKMGIDFKKTDCIVLSHGHYDHCGGLTYFPEKMPDIYLHNDALSKHYALNNDNTYRDIGIPWNKDFTNKIIGNAKYINKKTQISENIFVCGEIPSTEVFEGVPEGFYTGEQKHEVSDIIKDEAVLVIDTKKGLCLFLGCSHAGVVNCIKHVNRLFPDKKIYLLAGGMHLDSASVLRVEMTIQHILNSGIEMIIPLHCTGLMAICEMKKHLKNKCCMLYAGEKIEI